MKAILFTQEDTAGFNDMQSRIHNHLLSKHGVNGFKYSADCWADITRVPLHEDKLVMEIDESEPRYSLILQALTFSEIDSIVDITIDVDN